MRRVFYPLLFRYNEERFFYLFRRKKPKKVSVILKEIEVKTFQHYFTGKGAAQK
ncbi:hypothetical protein PthstB1num2_32350 [Parageobacillus thermoglucosidasius]|nr:hypothetical protein PTHTG4_37070 [Parageobacillus thermoglucosidasius]GMO01195.1 hypothetical protein PthstB1num2_32350 [Parageobacillus thermoglucosidasius]